MSVTSDDPRSWEQLVQCQRNRIDVGDFHFRKHELYVVGISLLVPGLHSTDLLQDELA